MHGEGRPSVLSNDICECQHEQSGKERKHVKLQ
jgi:hypothetical protein